MTSCVKKVNAYYVGTKEKKKKIKKEVSYTNIIYAYIILLLPLKYYLTGTQNYTVIPIYCPRIRLHSGQSMTSPRQIKK